MESQDTLVDAELARLRERVPTTYIAVEEGESTLRSKRQLEFPRRVFLGSLLAVIVLVVWAATNNRVGGSGSGGSEFEFSESENQAHGDGDFYSVSSEVLGLLRDENKGNKEKESQGKKDSKPKEVKDPEPKEGKNPSKKRKSSSARSKNSASTTSIPGCDSARCCNNTYETCESQGYSGSTGICASNDLIPRNEGTGVPIILNPFGSNTSNVARCCQYANCANTDGFNTPFACNVSKLPNGVVGVLIDSPELNSCNGTCTYARCCTVRCTNVTCETKVMLSAENNFKSLAELNPFPLLTPTAVQIAMVGGGGGGGGAQGATGCNATNPSTICAGVNGDASVFDCGSSGSIMAEGGGRGFADGDGDNVGGTGGGIIKTGSVERFICDYVFGGNGSAGYTDADQNTFSGAGGSSFYGDGAPSVGTGDGKPGTYAGTGGSAATGDTPIAGGGGGGGYVEIRMSFANAAAYSMFSACTVLFGDGGAGGTGLNKGGSGANGSAIVTFSYT